MTEVAMNSPEEKRMFDAAEQLVDAGRSLLPGTPGYDPARMSVHQLESSAVAIALQAVMLQGYASERDASGVVWTSGERGLALAQALGAAVGQFVMGAQPAMRDAHMMAIMAAAAQVMADPSYDPFLDPRRKDI